MSIKIDIYNFGISIQRHLLLFGGAGLLQGEDGRAKATVYGCLYVSVQHEGPGLAQDTVSGLGYGKS